VILLCVRWYLAYGLSLRNLEEMMAERGVSVDHATVGRWVVRYSPELLDRFNCRKRAVSRKWHIDETYIKVRGRWMYLYRAIDSHGDTVEFWFSERRNLTAASCQTLSGASTETAWPSGADRHRWQPDQS
jgi:transposase-like protein